VTRTRWDVAGPASERILMRICRAHGVGFERITDSTYRWRLAFEFEPRRQARMLRVGIGRDANGRIAITSDGPWPDATPDMARSLAHLLTEYAECLELEGSVFDDFDALAKDIVERCNGDKPEADLAVVTLRSIEERIRVYPVKVAGEPWVAFSMTVGPEQTIDPAWALRVNAQLAYASLAWVSELERVELCYAMPLAHVTAARFDELILDLSMLWTGLREQLGGGAGDDTIA
jgi:hypothetical protein